MVTSMVVKLLGGGSISLYVDGVIDDPADRAFVEGLFEQMAELERSVQARSHGSWRKGRLSEVR